MQFTRSYMLLIALCLIGITTHAQYGRDRKPPIWFGGTVIRPAASVFLSGAEAGFAFNMVGRFYFGFQFGSVCGVVDDNMGANIPDKAQYYVTSTNLGININYVAMQADRSYLTLGIFDDLELDAINDRLYTLYSIPNRQNTSVYYRYLFNLYNSVRPGVSYYRSRWGVMLRYNFLSGKSRFATDADFEGPIITLMLATKHVRIL